ncbi:uncharacterized protein GGS25DRAFT_473981 [Hypoxylon fragiforme]|uniref:uncharacterized protein n=1 Tax=Hypoxylon fragiforme TaxID=63214 RepID=UPI0020C66C7A|nr:uncharacterized protein GGS25DRAFT_473981 [Hypoxylon fragiforme]KAI2612148.1 hypothetical protein GGS25DRAFT_473981 [Hypoxylon fragiforme]
MYVRRSVLLGRYLLGIICNAPTATYPCMQLVSCHLPVGSSGAAATGVQLFKVLMHSFLSNAGWSMGKRLASLPRGLMGF